MQTGEEDVNKASNYAQQDPTNTLMKALSITIKLLYGMFVSRICLRKQVKISALTEPVNNPTAIIPEPNNAPIAF